MATVITKEQRKIAEGKKPKPDLFSEVITLRVTPEVFKEWNDRVAQSCYDNRSEFFRDAVIRNKTTVTQVVKPSKDHHKAVYHLAKIGNNINQIAKHLHEEFYSKESDKNRPANIALYRAILEELSTINSGIKELI